MQFCIIIIYRHIKLSDTEPGIVTISKVSKGDDTIHYKTTGKSPFHEKEENISVKNTTLSWKMNC